MDCNFYALNPKPYTLNLKPETQNLKHTAARETHMPAPRLQVTFGSKVGVPQ